MKKMKGREKEWEEVQQHLFDDSEDENKIPSGRHLAITGERGIGKSLLLSEIASKCKENKIIAIYASIDPSINVGQLAERFESSFQQTLDLDNPNWGEIIREKLSGYRAMGFGVDKITDARSTIEAFCFRLVKSIQIVKNFPESESSKESSISFAKVFKTKTNRVLNRDFLRGVVIIIDEVDSANNKELPIGAVLKTIIEYLYFHDVGTVSLVIAGLPYMRDMIYQTHPSAWREFTKIELETLGNRGRHKMIKNVLADKWKGIREKDSNLNSQQTLTFRNDTLNEIAEISEGYPHWISNLTTYAVCKHIEEKGKKTENIITLNDLVLSKDKAFKKVWEDYYVSDYECLSSHAKNLLRLIALHTHDDVEIDILKDVSQIPSDVFENALSDLIKKQIVISDSDSGIYEYVKIRSKSYRNWVSQIIHPLLDPIGVSDIWNEEEGLPFPTIIAGEKSTAFESFIKLVRTYISSDQSVQHKPYDSMKQLFSSFPDRPAVVEFRKSLGMKDRTPTDTSPDDEDKKPFSKIWDDSDIVAIPHYFLGQASMSGIWTFDELLPGYGEKARKYFNYVLHNYSEACQFKDSWVAIPFSFVSKVLVSKEDIETPKNWENLNKGGGKISLHLDSCPDDISLWYEWHQLVDNSKWHLLERSATDQTPSVSQEAINLANESIKLSTDTDVTTKETSKGIILGSSHFSSIKDFASLIEKVNDGGFGNAGWQNSEQFNCKDNESPVSRFTYKSIWVDFAADLHKKANEDGKPLYWYELPTFNEGDYSQPLESWVFVIPKKNNSKFHRENAMKWAKFLVSTMSMGWQQEFQKTGGCSPINTLAKSAGIKYSQPWTDYVANVIRKAHDDKKGKLTNLRGKSRREIEIMQLEMAFLTYMYFERDEERESVYKVASLEDKKILSRFTKAFPALIEGLRKICVEN